MLFCNFNFLSLFSNYDINHPVSVVAAFSTKFENLLNKCQCSWIRVCQGFDVVSERNLLHSIG